MLLRDPDAARVESAMRDVTLGMMSDSGEMEKVEGDRLDRREGDGPSRARPRTWLMVSGDGEGRKQD
jgi:hypothetical protein